MSTQQTEALPALIERFRGLHFDHAPDGWPAVRTREITALLARITELESQLAQRFDAADMATAAAQAAAQGVAYAEMTEKYYLAGGKVPTWDAKQMRAFADATHALRASHGQAYPTIDDLCARIKAADDAAADRDYMLDSNDCIAVLRGEWKGPLTMDKPERASHGQAPAGANENAKLVTLIAKCRDAFPIPDHGDPIENYWSAAIEDPSNVPAYLQEIAKRKQADSVQEDAARYRWLRERSSTMFVNVSINGDGAEIAETLDSAVDAARKQGATL